MSEQAYLELQVGTRDFLEVARILRDLPNAAASAEAGMQKWVRATEDGAAKAAAAAEKAAKREADAWNDALQKALGRYDKQAAAAEKAAQRQAQVAERAAARENEAWNNALQRSLARYEKQAEAAEKAAKREEQAHEKAAGEGHGEHHGGVFAGFTEGLQGGVGGFAGAAIIGGGIAVGEKLAETMIEGAHEVVATAVEIDRLKARLVGVTGSVDEANEKFNELEEMTLGKMPAKVDEVQNAFIQLSNVGLGAGKEALKSYANIAAQTGAAIGDVTTAVMMASMGNYRSLRQFGVGMKAEGDTIQATFRGTTTEIANSSSAIEQYLQRIGNVEFAGAVERQMETMGGAIKKWSDAWEEVVDTIARSKIGDVIRTSIGGAAELVFGLAKAVDALLYNISKLPKNWSKERRESFDAWLNSPGNTTTKPEDPAELAEKRKKIEADLYAEIKGGSKMTETQFTAELRKRMGVKENEPEWGREKTDAEQASEDKIQSIIDSLNKNTLSGADVKQREYAERDAALKAAQASGMMGDLSEAIEENFRQYARDVGGGKPGKEKEEKGIGIMDIMSKLDTLNKNARDRKAEQAAESGAREYEQIKSNLARQEDAVKASYERQKAWLEQYTGDDAAELLAANEVMWEKHNAKLKQQEEERAAEEKQQHDAAMELLLKGDERIMAEAEKQEDSYAKLRAKGVISETEFVQLKVQLHIEANRKIAESNLEHMQQMVTMSGAMFGNLATAAKNWGGETSKVYKGLFATQKAFAVASTTVAMFQDIAKAEAEGGPYAGPIIALSVAGRFAQILSQLSSANYAGAYDDGGYIPSGKVGIVGERGPELVRGPANVTSRVDTARMASGASQGSGDTRIINVWDEESTHKAFNNWAGSAQGQRAIMNVVRINESTMRTF